MHRKSRQWAIIAALLCTGACAGDFDPATAVRIEYENPRGCDEVSGTITLKASVQGDNAPVAAAMRYELRTQRDGDPVVLTGNAPSYEVLFDTTALRDGLVYLTAVPLDGDGNSINIKAFPYNAPGFIPPDRGIMVNNGTIDLTRPLILFSAVMEPYVGTLDDVWTPEQLQAHLTFAASLMTHLRSLGFVPEMCFSDTKTIVADPADPLAEDPATAGAVVDMTGQLVAGSPAVNRGTLCLPTLFWEMSGPNGLLDIWEHTAFDNVRAYATYGPVNIAPQVDALFREIHDRLTGAYTTTVDVLSMFEHLKPVPYGEPENPLKDKIKRAVAAGATCVLVFDFYHKTNDFEMSAGSWPHVQETIDEVNHELGTGLRLGAVMTNALQLMDYDSFLRAVYLSVRECVMACRIAPGRKTGIILAAHGSSKTNRLYDISRINNQVLYDRVQSYMLSRMAGMPQPDAQLRVCFSEYANSPDDGRPGVSEQAAAWIQEGFDDIIVYPLEWPWPSRDIWEELRTNTMELIDEANTEIYVRDDRNRSTVQLQGTRLVIGETMLDQKLTCPAACHYLKNAAAQLLEDRLAALQQRAAPIPVSGTLSLAGGPVDISLPFTDSLIAQSGKLMLQHAGIRGSGTTEAGSITGTLDPQETAHYLFTVLAEHAVAAETITVGSASVAMTVTAAAAHGTISASANATISGMIVALNLNVEL